MSPVGDPWELPSCRAFLDEAAELLAGGGGALVGGPSLPPGLPRGLEIFLRNRHSTLVIRRLEPDIAASPVEVIAAEFGIEAADVWGLVRATGLSDHVVLVDMVGKTVATPGWAGFLRRVLAAQSRGRSFFSIFLMFPEFPTSAEGLPTLAWGGRLRRLDITIWADLHAPLSRVEPLTSLAAALAVELGAWRLDLAAAIAAAPAEDLLDPLTFLETWRNATQAEEDFIDGVKATCSVALLECGELSELRQRVWRAQLRALFPWIEELRQKVIVRHSRQLIVDQQQRAMGARTLEDIEFGAIEYQLRSKVPPVEADLLRALARLRNDLAHHKPVAPADLGLVLQNLKRAGYG